jgi:soluble lytic murein transglycosylase-like protein
MNRNLLFLGAAGLATFLFSRAPARSDAGITVPSSVTRWRALVEGTARGIQYPFDPDVALATVWQESAGNPDAQGSAGEHGLMQITRIALQDVKENFPRTAGALPSDPSDLDPSEQVISGMLYQKLQGRRVGGDRFRMLRAYNEGPPPLSRSASQQYAESVIQKLEVIRR